MRAAKIFRVIWRINAVVILLASAALLIAVLSFAAGSLFQRDTGHAEPAPPVVAATAQKEQLRLRPLRPVEETTALRGELVEEETSRSYSSKGDASETRNVLTVDVPEHVTKLDSASTVNGLATIVCQRDTHYIVITADPIGLAKLTEREITIPQLR